MWTEEDWTSQISTSASCVEEAVSGSQQRPSQQQQEQVVRPLVHQHQQQRLVRVSVWPHAEQQQSGIKQEEDFLAAQDEQLDTLEATVGNLKTIGLQIGEEVDSHQHLLSELDERVEQTHGVLHRNMLLLRKVVDRQSTTCLCCIAIILFLTLLLLLFLAY